MMQLSQVARAVPTSPTLALNAEAKRLAAAGEDVINMTVGEPDFDTPDNVKQAAHRAIQAGFTKYLPAAGMPDLREAIAAKLRRENGIDCSPEEVIVSNGAKQVLYLLFRCVLNPGDQVVLCAPYWVTYAQQVRMCGAEPVVADATDRPDLRPDAELIASALTDRTRAIVINSPCNPSGAVLGEEVLRPLVELALERGIWLISDEVYEKLIYDGLTHLSPAALCEEARRLVITVNGFSKTYAMTGWRIGYAAGPSELIRAAANLQSHMTSGADSIAQKAALEALTGPQDSVEHMRRAFEERRRLLLDGLSRIEGIRCPLPQGAFYALLDCRGLMGGCWAGRTVNSSLELCQALLECVRLAAVPGSAFGAEGFVRLSYATATERVVEAIERLERFVGMRQG